MKKFVIGMAVLEVAIFCFCGCGKKSETGSSHNSMANYPLPNPPLLANCSPGIPGGRLVVATFGEPKTFNPITANENSSQ